MKKITSLLILVTMITGCTTVSQNINNAIISFKNYGPAEKIEVNASYKDTFQAVINVFHDLDIAILKKDYEDKIILGTISSPAGITANVGTIKYVIIFSQKAEDRIEIVLKSSTRTVTKKSFILRKIQEELALQKKINW